MPDEALHIHELDGPRRGLVRTSPAARVALALIRAYKYLISPWLTGACRYMPTCADYTAEAITRYGLLEGGWLGARRIGRCHPFGGSGYDPVPTGESGTKDPTD